MLDRRGSCGGSFSSALSLQRRDALRWGCKGQPAPPLVLSDAHREAILERERGSVLRARRAASGTASSRDRASLSGAARPEGDHRGRNVESLVPKCVAKRSCEVGFSSRRRATPFTSGGGAPAKPLSRAPTPRRRALPARGGGPASTSPWALSCGRFRVSRRAAYRPWVPCR